DDFVQYSETKASRAKYLLQALEKTARLTEHGPSAADVGPVDTLTVEHIFPRNPGAEWQPEMKKDQDLRTNIADRIGNLCLVAAEANRKLGNCRFESKARQVFQNSASILTQEVA